MFCNINIIGYGYVGGSIGYLCNKRGINYTITDTCDKSGNGEVSYFANLEETIHKSEVDNEVNYYFICVPTPSKYNHECDTSIVQSIFKIISETCTKKTVVIIKSTVSPGTTRKLHSFNKNKDVSLFFSPEFLTEKNANLDVMNEKKLILGASDDKVDEAALYVVSKMYNSTEITSCQYEYAEMMKYTINVYLAQKVHFFNDIYDVCKKMAIDYDQLKKLVVMDSRISPSHTSVPGHDTKFGFGGSCLVKETKGMSYLRNQLGLDNIIIGRILDINATRRGESIKLIDSLSRILLEEHETNGINVMSIRDIEIQFFNNYISNITYSGRRYTYDMETDDRIYFKNSDEGIIIITMSFSTMHNQYFAYIFAEGEEKARILY